MYGTIIGSSFCRATRIPPFEFSAVQMAPYVSRDIQIHAHGMHGGCVFACVRNTFILYFGNKVCIVHCAKRNATPFFFFGFSSKYASYSLFHRLNVVRAWHIRCVCFQVDTYGRVNVCVPNETMETICMHTYGARDYECLAMLCIDRTALLNM